MRKHLLRFLLIVMIVCFGVGIMAACGDDTEGENPNPDEAATYTLTYKANGGVGADKTEQHKEGDTVTVLGADTFTYDGHTFTKWKEEGGSAEYNAGATFTMPGRNVTLAAQWQANGSSETEYEIKVTDPTGKAHVEFDKEPPYHTGDVVKFTVDFAPGENLRVVSVKADGVELQKGEDGKYTVTVAEKDVGITIESEPMGEHEFNVSLSVTGGGNGNSATLDKEGVVGKDEKVTLTVVTADGYTAEVKLNGNHVDLNAQGKYELTVTENAAFTVVFTKNSAETQEYTVSLNVTGGGNGNSAELDKTGKVAKDTKVTLTVVTAAGYSVEVKLNGNHVDLNGQGKYELTVTQDAAFTVVFTKNGENPPAKNLTAFHNANAISDNNDTSFQIALRAEATGYASAEEMQSDLKLLVGTAEFEAVHVDAPAGDSAIYVIFFRLTKDGLADMGASEDVTLKSVAANKTYPVPAVRVDDNSSVTLGTDVYTLAYEGEKLVLKHTAEEPAPADEIDGVWTVESDEGTVTLYIKKVADGIDVAEIIGSGDEAIGTSIHIPEKSDNTYGFETPDGSTTVTVVDGTLTFTVTVQGQAHPMTSTSKEALPASIALPNGVYEDAEGTVTLTLGASSSLRRVGSERKTVTTAIVGDYICLYTEDSSEHGISGVKTGSLAKQEADGTLTLYVGEESFKLTKQTGEEPERSAYNFHDAELWTDGLNVTLNMWFDTTGYTKAQLNDACTLTVNGVTCARYNAGDVLDNGGTLRWFLLNDLTAVADAKVCVVIDGDSYDVKVSTISDGNKTKEFKNKTYTIAKDADGNLTLTVENLPEDPTKVPKASGDADAQNYPDKWSVYDPDGKATAKYEDETLKFSWTDRGGQVWWAVQLYYVDSRLSVGDKYTVSFTVTAKFEITAEKPLILRFFEGDAFAADITITAQDTPVSFQSAEATLNGNKQAIKMFICARDAAENDRYGSGSIEISNLEVTPVEMTTLETPSISFEGNTYTITDPNGEGVKEYQVGLYKGDEAYHTFTVATTAMTGTLDVSSMANGEYTVKVMAVAAEGHFRSSGWSEGVSYTVSNSEPRSYQLPYSEEKDMPVDEWVYWTDNNNDDNNIVPTENTYNNGTVTLQFHHNTNGPEYHWHTQLFYRNPELNGTDHTFLMYIESTASGKITVNGKAVELIEGQKVKVYGNFAEGRAHITIQFAVWGEAENSAIQEGKITITDIQFDVSEGEPQKPTFTFVKGEGAEGEDPRLEAEDPNDWGSYTVNLPKNPYTAPEGKYFRGWQINDTVYFPEEAYDAEAGATITVTAVWEDLYVSYDQSVTLSHTWTNPVNVVVTNGAPAIELTATVSDTTPTDWHGILVDINMTIKGASASDFIRLRLDGYIFTFNDDTTNTANIGTDVSKWNATSYTSLFANGGKAVQRVTASLNGRILTYTIATYAEGTTDFSTAEPVVSVTYTVESAVDVNSLTLAFYYDDGVTGDAPNNTMSFTDAKVKVTVPVSENQDPTAEKPITIGTADNKLGYTGTPLWTSKLKKGEKVVLNGTMTSAATNNFDAAGMYLYDGISSNFNIRADNFVNGNTSSDAWPMTTPEGWSITSSNTGSTVVAVGGDWWAGAKAILKKADVEITFDYTGENVIVTFKATGTDENAGDNLGKIFTYAYTVAKGTGTFADEFTIGLGGESSYTVINSLTRTSVKA